MSVTGIDLEQGKAYYNSIWKQRDEVQDPRFRDKDLWETYADDWAKTYAGSDQDERLAATVAYLKDKGALAADHDVIDIGCGPGQFAVRFAKYARSSVGTDISPRMLEHAAGYAKAGGVSNVSFTACDFREADLSALGWTKNFDLVFTSNTPAMDSAGALEKVASMSRKWCFNSCFVDWLDPLEDRLRKEVFGLGPSQLSNQWKWFYCRVNLLLLNGYLPEVTYFTEHQKEVHTDLAQLAERATRFLKSELQQPISDDEVIGRTYEFLKRIKDENGAVVRSSTCKYGWILWNVNEKVF